MREPGSIVDDKYEVVESLGRGGMGEVYLVRHLHLEELRVIKILRQDLAADQTAQKRFLREARLATQIKHPNVAILYDFSQLPEGSFYMVWEHIEGRHVGEWLRERGRIPLLPALELGIQALRGLEAIHASGVVHRDVSPDNLMISRDRRGRYLVKIIDLGLAKNLVADPNFEVTQVGMFMGKLKYCSPEQAEVHEGETVDSRSDLYSFALVLYEMITGQPPFDADNPHAAVTKRLTEDPVPPSERQPEAGVPPELDAIFARALARQPEDRFPDAVELIEALEPVAWSLRKEAGEGPRQRPHRPTEIPTTAASQAGEDEEDGGGGGKAARRDETSQLSKAERLDLLAQIDRAARRQSEASQILAEAETLFKAGEPEQAAALVRRLEAKAPRTRGLARLKQRLKGTTQPEPEAASAVPEPAAPEPPSEAESAAPEPEVTVPQDPARQEEAVEQEAEGPDVGERIREVEKMVESYIQKGQVQLAELALDTLLELDQDHPRQAEYGQWLDILRDEVEQDRQADEALAAGRRAIADGDFKAAGKRLAELEKQDRAEEQAASLRRELEAARRQDRQSSDSEDRRQRFEEALAAGDVSAAAAALQALEHMEVSRVTLDLLRRRLQAARRDAASREQLAALEQQYRQHLEAEDWMAAREVAVAVEQAVPDSPRPAEMYAEIGQWEEQHRRRQSLTQGRAQVESLIEAGEAEQARLALDILLRMAPDLAGRKQLEKKIERLAREG